MDREREIPESAALLYAIDQKLEKILEYQTSHQETSVEEIRSFIEQLAETVSVRFIGNFPQSIEKLERKIDHFEHDLKNFLDEFSRVLIQYENKLEARIKSEMDSLDEKFQRRHEGIQQEQKERLEHIGDSIDNLARAISDLRSGIFNFSEKLEAAFENLEARNQLSKDDKPKKQKSWIFGKTQDD